DEIKHRSMRNKMSENDDVIRIMSIHKSKGLEFPVVIMAGLNKQINKMDARNRLVIDQELGIGTDYVNLDKHTKTSTIIKGAVARKILRGSISEEERVLVRCFVLHTFSSISSALPFCPITIPL
ncbi:MAG: hypothetical protein EGP80_14790, partial [Blautia wexlerae]|nr:hypothetical protein [Blautia wexlerae]